MSARVHMVIYTHRNHDTPVGIWEQLWGVGSCFLSALMVELSQVGQQVPLSAEPICQLKTLMQFTAFYGFWTCLAFYIATSESYHMSLGHRDKVIHM